MSIVNSALARVVLLSSVTAITPSEQVALTTFSPASRDDKLPLNTAPSVSYTIKYRPSEVIPSVLVTLLYASSPPPASAFAQTA